MAKKAEKKVDEYPKVLETFREVGNYELGNLKQDEPSSFNRSVNVRRYRITIELIDEPDEVIAERIRDLWERCDNHHQWDPLRSAAKRYGIELSYDTCGIRAEKRR